MQIRLENSSRSILPVSDKIFDFTTTIPSLLRPFGVTNPASHPMCHTKKDNSTEKIKCKRLKDLYKASKTSTIRIGRRI